MKATYLSEVVLQRRNDLGLPQEMVCEGLCTPMTLSRFEKGRQTPSWDCVEAILQRLGLPDDPRYFAQLTRRETTRLLLRKKARASYKQFEQALGAERQRARIEALETLHRLEHCIKEDDRINQQFILGMKPVLEGRPPQEQLEILLEAIHLTSPRFDPNDLSRCLYSANEVVLINRIAISYVCCGQRGKAIDIYAQLFNILLKRSPDHNHLSLIAYNYALQLGLAKRLEESLRISEFGQKICIKHGYHHLIPRFLHVEAECYYLMGEIDRSIKLYQAAYYIYGATMGIRDQEDLKADAKERFGLVFYSTGISPTGSGNFVD